MPRMRADRPERTNAAVGCETRMASAISRTLGSEPHHSNVVQLQVNACSEAPRDRQKRLIIGALGQGARFSGYRLRTSDVRSKIAIVVVAQLPNVS